MLGLKAWATTAQPHLFCFVFKLMPDSGSVSGVSVSSLSDGILVIHVSPVDKQQKVTRASGRPLPVLAMTAGFPKLNTGTTRHIQTTPLELAVTPVSTGGCHHAV